jgi:hypothetical protein
MLRTSRREGSGARLLIDLASGRLSEAELEELVPVLLAAGPQAPENLIQAALTVPAARRLLRTA